MIRVDGRKIRDAIKERLKNEIASRGVRPRLLLVYVGEDPVIDSFIEIKRKFGEDIGVQVDIERFPADITSERLQSIMARYQESEGAQAVIVQLPLPSHIDTDETLNLIPHEKDADVLSEEALKRSLMGAHPLQPVVGAIYEVFERHQIDLREKKIVIVGRGRLVGKPLSISLIARGCPPLVLEKGDDLKKNLHDADIVISGAGAPGIVTPDMVKEGVVLVDAGTSDVGGVTTGDIDPHCAEKASLYTPVPGGIGPITVAKLFENLVWLTTRDSSVD